MTNEEMKELERRLDLTGAIEAYLWDELNDGDAWASPEMILGKLRQAQCINGSWGGLIYTKDVLAKLADDQWQDAIDEALSEITDCDQAPRILSLGELVWRVVDHTAAGMGHRLGAILEAMKDEVAA